MRQPTQSTIEYHYITGGSLEVQPYLGTRRENAIIEDLKWRRARSPSTTIVVVDDDVPQELTPTCRNAVKEFTRYQELHAKDGE